MAALFSIDRWYDRALLLRITAAGATLLLLRLLQFAFSRPEWDDLPTLTRANPVLLSDDDSIVMDLLRLILERFGLTVVCTPSGEDALAMCRTMPISLVISDVMKPGMDGFTLLKHLRADPATRDIPVMFVSAGSGMQRILAATEAGADDYLIKPVAVREFGDRVCALLTARGRWTVSPGGASRELAHSSD